MALLLNSVVSGAKVAPQAASSCALTVLGVLVIGWHDQLMLHLEQVAVFFEVVGREGFEGATAAAAAAGDDIIMGPELSLYGVVMGLIAAAANAAAFVVVGLIGKDVSPVNVCWWQYCVTTHAAVAVILLSQLESAVVQASVASGSLDPWSIDPNSSLGVLSSMAESTSGLGSSLYGIADGTSGLAVAAAAGGGGGGLGFENLQQLAQNLILQMQQSLPNQHDALLLSGVVVANFLGQLLLNAGFQRVDAGRGAAVNTLQVLFANVWDVLLLHSAPSGGILVGLGMIAAGVFGTRQSASEGPQPPQQQQQQLSQR
jgi:drug/metabolite transporter (DMT)-like permease